MKQIITITLCIISFIFCAVPVYGKTFSISRTGQEHIKQYESCKLTAYWDGNGYSIGYGHHGKDVSKGMRISKAKADALFRQDIINTNEKINRLISALPYSYNFSQNFIDGLGDLIYNCGEGGVKRSDFYKRLMRCRVKNNIINKNDLTYAIAAVKTMCISANGHKHRRYETHLKMLK